MIFLPIAIVTAEILEKPEIKIKLFKCQRHPFGRILNAKVHKKKYARWCPSGLRVREGNAEFTLQNVKKLSELHIVENFFYTVLCIKEYSLFLLPEE
jgi:hypothetical protein